MDAMPPHRKRFSEQLTKHMNRGKLEITSGTEKPRRREARRECGKKLRRGEARRSESVP